MNFSLEKRDVKICSLKLTRQVNYIFMYLLYFSLWSIHFIDLLTMVHIPLKKTPCVVVKFICLLTLCSVLCSEKPAGSFSTVWKAQNLKLRQAFSWRGNYHS